VTVLHDTPAPSTGGQGPGPLFDPRLLAESALAAYQQAIADGRPVSLEAAHLARIAMITATGGRPAEVMLAAVADELAAARVPDSALPWPGRDRGRRLAATRKLSALAEHLGVPARTRYGKGGASTPYLEGACPGGGFVTVAVTETGWSWTVRDPSGHGTVEGSWAHTHAPAELTRVARAVRADIEGFSTAQAARRTGPAHWLLAGSNTLPEGSWTLMPADGGARLQIRVPDGPPLWVWARAEEQHLAWAWCLGWDGAAPDALAFTAAPAPEEIGKLLGVVTAAPEAAT
jgi:hypothetical protein